MAVNLSTISFDDLSSLQKRIGEEISRREKDIQATHTSEFVTLVGLDILLNIPIVEASQVNLQKPSKYPECLVRTEMLGEKSAVRGIDGWNRPFIAIKVDLIDNKTDKKVTQLVEVVFRRHPLETPTLIYVTALTNMGDDKKKYWSGLYKSGGMIPEQIVQMGKLLRGEKIQSPCDDQYSMQLSS